MNWTNDAIEYHHSSEVISFILQPNEMLTTPVGLVENGGKGQIDGAMYFPVV